MALLLYLFQLSLQTSVTIVVLKLSLAVNTINPKLEIFRAERVQMLLAGFVKMKAVSGQLLENIAQI